MTIWDEPMQRALNEAHAAGLAGDVPVGAAVVDLTGAIIATAGNERQQSGDPTAHAEILALRRAAEKVGTWHLDGCTLVVTLEPCTMCAGAAVLSRVRRIVFGALDPKAGAVASLFDVVRDPRLNHRPLVTGGIRAEECGELLSSFFGKISGGDVSEWPMEPASKAGVGQPTEGSNPSVTAKKTTTASGTARRTSTTASGTAKKTAP